MKIQLVDLKANYLSIKEEIDQAIQNIIDNTSFIMGEPVTAFEEEWASYCEVKHAIGVGNGTDALIIALKSLGIKEGDEVITVANTFIATTEAISANGAKPVFVDINEDDYTINVNLIEEKINSKTKAIVCVHLYGHPCDMDKILSLAKKYNLKIVEDCAQAHGGKYNNKILGTIGDVGCFSMFPAKVLGAFGDAGAIITNNDELADKCNKLRNHGRKTKYESVCEGYNSRLDALQAAILSVKLKYLDEWITKRRSIANTYSKKLTGVVTPVEQKGAFHSYYMYVIRAKNRDDLMKQLKEEEISTGIHYPVPLHIQEAYNYLGYKEGDLPITEKVAKEILSIPLYPELEPDMQEKIIERINNYV